MKTRDELERERRRGNEQREKSFIGMGGAIVIVLGGGAIGLFVMLADHVKPPPPVVASTVPVMTDSLQCDRLVQIFQREGIVVGDRVGNRILVDDKRWSALDSRKRLDLLQYVACAAFAGRGLDSLDQGEVVDVVSAASRKRLARAGRGKDGAVFTLDY
ncbi:MAG TPA: hypothetical protein VF503_03450 [Sphingobium sp.]|uniref:hypothetical protein n=1 Tax=Sphingobium sp. TaxID=1912891 RepID=UPI002ED08724